jgi:leukotriene A-4 hydrolase/aminopeptidase
MKRRYMVIVALAVSSCAPKSQPPKAETVTSDVHSYSQPEEARIRNLDADLEVSFASKTLAGTVTLDIEGAGQLVLDTRDLTIQRVEAESGGAWTEVKFALAEPDKALGSALRIDRPTGASRVRVHYRTSATASGLQWLEPRQTAGKKHPFLFSQSQAIHARSWIPLQDTPGVRFTYTARIRTPRELVALMSAENDPRAPRTGEYRFRMPQAIPSYLMALAVGDVAFRPVGQRSGVYAEPAMVEKAAREFEDTEKMMHAAESLYGSYRWGRYDILVLPPSFPYGGMENPRLTFATPTVIAGDKSLVALIAHELAHSWSGNLVTNATWSDFWLNEGTTTYIERRIQEQLFGPRRAAMEAVLGRQTLDRTLAELPDRDEILYVDLSGRDPDEGMTEVPYEKGALLFRTLEQAFGRERFDSFLRKYFDHFAFRSITTEQFIDYLKTNLLSSNSDIASRIPLEQWIFKPGIPDGAATVRVDAFAAVEEQARRWSEGELRASALPGRQWTTHEWLHFFHYFDERGLAPARMAELDRTFNLTGSGNSEILHAWLILAVRNGYEAAYAALERFLTEVGRRKFLRPLYQELLKTPEGRKRAEAIYANARPGYHPIAQATVDELLRGK